MCNDIKSRDRPKLAPRSSFLNLQRTPISNFYFFSVPKISTRKTRETRKPIFLQQKKTKHPFFEFLFRKRLLGPKKRSTPKLLFLKPKSALNVLKYIEVIAFFEARNKFFDMYEQLLQLKQVTLFVFQREIIINFWCWFCKSVFC